MRTASCHHSRTHVVSWGLYSGLMSMCRSVEATTDVY
nr:MAG TPA: hypothetical protein [Caudoviricetes sp.]